jgi:hypothetical protein
LLLEDLEIYVGIEWAYGFLSAYEAFYLRKQLSDA